MLSPLKASCLVASLLLTAGFASAAAISANGTCEIGTCASPGTLSPGQSIPTTPFGFTYVFADTDTYFVFGTYSASGTAPSIAFTATADYIGNSSSTASSADTLSVDLLEMFAYNGSPDGTYSETATLTTGNGAPGTTVSAQLSFGGQGIGLLGPYAAVTPKTFSASKPFSGLTNPNLADFNYTFAFAAGTPAVPEPAAVGLSAVGCLLFLAPVLRRRRLARRVI